MKVTVRVIGDDLVWIDCHIKLDYRDQDTDAFRDAWLRAPISVSNSS